MADYAYHKIERLREILLTIFKLFYKEHKGLKDLSEDDEKIFQGGFEN